MSQATPSSISLQDKMKAKRRVMQDLRGNKSSMATLDKVEGLPPNVQLQVAQQIAQNKKRTTRATTEKAKKAVEKKAPTKKSTKATAGKKAATVSQSTADTMQTLQRTNMQVLLASVEQNLNDFIQGFPPAQRMVMEKALDEHRVEIQGVIQTEMSKWIQTGKLPDVSTLQEFIRTQIHKKLDIPSHFNHSDDTSNNPSSTTLTAPSGAVAQPNPTQLSTTPSG